MMYLQKSMIVIILAAVTLVAVASPKTKSTGAFEREQTQKQNVELLQLEDPGASNGLSPSENKPAPRNTAEIERTRREIERLRGHIEAGQQMLSENEGNQGAQVKILSTLTMLKVELRKLESKLKELQEPSTNDIP